jgi:hypothetical protein
LPESTVINKPFPRDESSFLPSVWLRKGARFLGDLRTSAGRQAIKERSGYQGAWFHAWLFPITRHGKLLMLSFALTALPASISVDVPIYEVSVGVVCLLLSATTVGSWYRFARTGLTGSFPASVVAGDPLRGSFRLTNRSWVDLHDIGIGCFLPPRSIQAVDPSRVVERVARGESVELPVVLATRRRGRFKLPPVRVFTLFPFAIGRNELARMQTGAVTVLPRLARVGASLDARASSFAEDGESFRRGVADPTDYLGSREYVPGDDIRRVDHRAWSRWGRPVVREFGVPSSAAPVLVFDCRPPVALPADWAAKVDVAPSVTVWQRLRRVVIRAVRHLESAIPGLTGARRRYRDEVFEAAVSLVAGLLSEWSGGTRNVRFVCSAWPEPVEVGPGATSFESVWDRLADSLTARSDPARLVDTLAAEFALVEAEIHWITGEYDGQTRDAVARLTAAGARVRVVWVRRGGTVPEQVRTITPRAVREEVVHVG